MKTATATPPSRPPPPVLDLTIHKQLDGFTLDLALTAPEEAITVLFGPSGAGKSLTLAALAGLLTPDLGRIAIGDRVLFDSARGINLAPRERRLGLVRQDLALFPHLSVEQNVGYGLYRQPRAAAQAWTAELLRMVGLEELAHKKPLELSGGQQQRVALARALAIRPSLLLLDEPFSALDQPARVELRAELRRLQRQLGTAILFVTHDLAEAYLLADLLAVLDRGRLLQLGEPDRVLNQPDSLRVAQILGIRNILPAQVLSASRMRIGASELETPSHPFKPGESVYVCLRPERITLVRKGRRLDDLPNMMVGDLIGEESDGANVMLRWRAQGPRLCPDRPFDLQIDTPVYVYERLNLAAERAWAISIKPAVMHLIPAFAPDAGSC